MTNPDDRCDIKGCESKELIRTMVHVVWVCMCRTHMNRLAKYLGSLQEHQDHLVNVAAYKRAMSGYPSASGMSSDEEVMSNFLTTENKIRNIIEAWVSDPDEAERIMNYD
jgi:hypothetical protein